MKLALPDRVVVQSDAMPSESHAKPEILASSLRKAAAGQIVRSVESHREEKRILQGRTPDELRRMAQAIIVRSAELNKVHLTERGEAECAEEILEDLHRAAEGKSTYLVVRAKADQMLGRLSMIEVISLRGDAK